MIHAEKCPLATLKDTWGGLRAYLETLNDAKDIGESVQMVDSTIVRAHHCAAGEKGGLKIRVLGGREAASQPRYTFAPIAAAFQSAPSSQGARSLTTLGLTL